MEGRAESVSNASLICLAAAAFNVARVSRNCSGEYLQFLNCVLPSYKGREDDDDAVVDSVMVDRRREVRPWPPKTPIVMLKKGTGRKCS